METLITMGLLSVVALGTLKVLTISNQSSQMMKATFSEQELRGTVTHVLSNDNDCKENFKPATGKLEGTDNQKGIGTISKLEKDSVLVLEAGKSFKNNLEIVKMEMIGDASEDPKIQSVGRSFVVYYSKKMTGKLRTQGGGECTSSDTSGCYFVQCTVDYRLENNSNPDVLACNTLNCIGGSSVSCYTADSEDVQLNTITNSLTGFISKEIPNSEKEGKGRALVGCGGTSDINVSATTAFGYEAGINTTNDSGDINYGKFNTFLGYQAGYFNTTGSRNTFSGFMAGYSNTTGHNNTFIGEYAGYFNKTGFRNTFIGKNAGAMSDIGEQNTFIGTSAGIWNRGSYNTFIGYVAGVSNTTGKSNIFIGVGAGRKGTTGSSNVFIGGGYQATTGYLNTYVGKGAGSSWNEKWNPHVPNTMPPNEGHFNTFIGRMAGWPNSTGFENTFLGMNTGRNNNTGYRNTFVGTRAGYGNTTGHDNIFIGYQIRQEGTPLPQQDYQLNIGNLIVGRLPKVHTGGMYVHPDDDIAADYGLTAASNYIRDQSLIPTLSLSSNPIVFIRGDLKVLEDATIDKTLTVKEDTFLEKKLTVKEDTLLEKELIVEKETTLKKGLTVDGDPTYLNKGLTVMDGLTVSTGGLNVSGGGLTVSGPITCLSSTCASHGHTNLDSRYARVHNHPYASSGHGHSIGDIIGHGSHCATCPPSSRTLKKNIKAFKNFEKALKDIKNTPLFTYEYKENHPHKKRVGIISEELPEHLQIKDEGVSSRPDWPSIYGTFWAAIKALSIKFEDFTKNILSEVKKIKEQITTITNQLSGMKTVLEKQIKEITDEFMKKMVDTDKNLEKNSKKLTGLDKQIIGIVKTSKNNQEEIDKLNTSRIDKEKILSQQQKELKQLRVILKNTTAELNRTEKELQNSKVEFRERLTILEEKIKKLSQ